MVNIKDIKIKSLEEEQKMIKEFEKERAAVEKPLAKIEKPNNIEKDSLREKLEEEKGKIKQTETESIIKVSNAQQKWKRRQKQIEEILADDLEDIFLKMPADKQAEFKKAGEETARKINDLLDKAKVKIKQIISLIKKWFQLIPGINKFFLEKEAKIKADRIIKLRQVNQNI
ncbi:MAG: hypothetical protein ABIG60_01130 [Patescibacteria group bacterium]